MRARRKRRTPASAAFRLFRRVWLPLVVVAVVIAGGFAVSRLHNIFGTVNALSYGDTKVDDETPINPKYLRYEIFGPPGTVAQISYFDENGNPKFIRDVPLPWSHEFPITTAAGVGSIAANGDSESLGCRILVDNVVKSENIKQHAVSTFTSCMLKAA
ncbi:MmpS family transport accessory protein [Mycolicibacterium pulveris]|uniref:MmpS family transport accessory protein n=1 Tax=Mycolicibacterium pulveris TaxID=36813 RepID=UPI003CF9B8E2